MKNFDSNKVPILNVHEAFQNSEIELYQGFIKTFKPFMLSKCYVNGKFLMLVPSTKNQKTGPLTSDSYPAPTPPIYFLSISSRVHILKELMLP